MCFFQVWQVKNGDKNCVEEFADIELNKIADKYIEGELQIAELPVMLDETNAPKVQRTGVQNVAVMEGTIKKNYAGNVKKQVVFCLQKMLTDVLQRDTIILQNSSALWRSNY